MGDTFFVDVLLFYRYIVLSEIVFKPSCAQCSSCAQWSGGGGGGRVQAVDDDDKDIVKDL